MLNLMPASSNGDASVNATLVATNEPLQIAAKTMPPRMAKIELRLRVFPI